MIPPYTREQARVSVLFQSAAQQVSSQPVPQLVLPDYLVCQIIETITFENDIIFIITSYDECTNMIIY